MSGTPPVRPRSRLRGLLDELVKFGLVGAIGFVVDVGVFNLLRFDGAFWPAPLEHKPVTAKVISVTVATVATYLGNRHWTWRDRARSGLGREYAAFFAFNGIGLAIAAGCLGISHYLLGFTSALADNISANGVGLVLGTAFRFWSYRTYVFRPTEDRTDSTASPSSSHSGGSTSKRSP